MLRGKRWTLQRYLIKKKILVAILIQYCEAHITYTVLMHTWITNVKVPTLEQKLTTVKWQTWGLDTTVSPQCRALTVQRTCWWAGFVSRKKNPTLNNYTGTTVSFEPPAMSFTSNCGTQTHYKQQEKAIGGKTHPVTCSFPVMTS